AAAPRPTASGAERGGREPYAPGWQSASKLGARRRVQAPWPPRPPWPPFWGLVGGRTRLGRDVRVARAWRRGSRNPSSPLAARAAQGTRSTPGARGLAWARGEAAGRGAGGQRGPERPQKRQAASACAWASSRRRRAGRLLGGLGRAPLPPRLAQA